MKFAHNNLIQRILFEAERTVAEIGFELVCWLANTFPFRSVSTETVDEEIDRTENSASEFVPDEMQATRARRDAVDSAAQSGDICCIGNSAPQHLPF